MSASRVTMDTREHASLLRHLSAPIRIIPRSHVVPTVDFDPRESQKPNSSGRFSRREFGHWYIFQTVPVPSALDPGGVRHMSPMVNTQANGRIAVRGACLRMAVMTLAVGAAAASCRHLQPTEPGRVSIRLLNDTVRFRRYEHSVAFDITAVIRNDNAKTLYLWECLRTAQKLVDATWRPAWGEACTLGGAPPTQIVPGDSVIRSVTVAGFTDSSAAPSFLFAGAVEGTYRVTFPISLSKEVTRRKDYFPADVSSTPPFDVR
jgi:hypothetical protein